MPPKNSAKKGARTKGGSEGSELEGEDSQCAHQLRCQLHSLKLLLFDRSEEARLAKVDKRRLANKMGKLTRQHDEERALHLSAMTDATSTFERVRETLTCDIVTLSRKVQDLQDLIEEQNSQLCAKESEKEAALDQKDQEIAGLKKAADSMAREFSTMLSATLEKMNEHIELTSHIEPSKFVLGPRYNFERKASNWPF